MLRKQPAPVFIPPVPGRPGQPGGVICAPPYSPPPPAYTGIGGGSGGGGGGSTTCSSGCIAIGYEPDGSIAYLCGVPVCRRT